MSIAEGNFIEVPIEGPKEIQQLASTMNEMNRKVTSSLQSQRDFVANVSHEFKTPLTSIQGFAHAIYEGAVDTEEKRRKAAGVILSETDRLNSLVNELLVLAKLDAGMIEMELAQIDMNQVIDNLLEKFQYQIENAQLTVHKEYRLKRHILADGEQISQVFSNLIDNAIKYSKEGGAIMIKTGQAGAFARIEVCDTGIGISLEDRKRIFERFYQVDKSRKGGPDRGVGLGLAIAHQIVQSHGGIIEVESEKNKGSTFVVKLPLNHGKS